MPGQAIRIRGIVQGVGFRPYIWRLAKAHQLSGEVWNDGQGVMIHAFGKAADLVAFIQQIPLQLPPLARLDSLELQTLPDQTESCEFNIIASQHNTLDTPISADAATCPDCLQDIAELGNRRYRYPFTNCTHCGPRLSIIRRMPYDRCHTSMAEFALCPRCREEYDDPADRRFHAQANCCPDCGPKLWLEDQQGQILIDADPLNMTTELLRQGYIVAIKGLGGFHLACNATDELAVTKLRQRKQRYAKPFALMAGNIASIARYACLDEMEIQALQDKAAPIVLLTAEGEQLAPSVALDDDKLGFMLPYTPLHTLLLQNLEFPIVLTSANISDEPQCIANNEARSKLTEIADYLLLHDRAIVNRLDDSVVRLMDGKIRMLRRARGYCPAALPLPTGFATANNILAMGAELKNSFGLLKNGQAIISQHMGDLENAAVQLDYRNVIELYQALYDFQPAQIAVDNHPGYLSTQYGHQLAEATGAVLTPVQHHHAHLAACLAEHGIDLDAPPVLAAIFDGLGMGNAGELWGGEFLLGDYQQCTRLGHFQAIALPGGSQAMKEPWRNCYAQLAYYFDWPTVAEQYAELDSIQFLSAKPLPTLAKMIQANLNSPLSTSCGRWFDAFAAVLGLHPEQIAYEGQAAIALEILATPEFANQTPYPQAWRIERLSEQWVLNWQGLWQAVLDDLKCGTDRAQIAARIHHSLIAASVEMLMQLSEQTGIDCIVLSGGVFQNRLLLESLSQQLRQRGKTVLSPQRYPGNDGGVALGQMVVLAAGRLLG